MTQPRKQNPLTFQTMGITTMLLFRFFICCGLRVVGFFLIFARL